jgi:hypothetical protein
MKKLVLSLAIIGFVAFGAVGVQHLIAASTQTEIVNFDKDPKKEDTKKVADTKEVKAETTTTSSSDEKSCSSSCSDKSASAKSCCGSEKACCTSSTPEKK